MWLRNRTQTSQRKAVGGTGVLEIKTFTYFWKQQGRKGLDKETEPAGSWNVGSGEDGVTEVQQGQGSPTARSGTAQGRPLSLNRHPDTGLGAAPAKHRH